MENVLRADRLARVRKCESSAEKKANGKAG